MRPTEFYQNYRGEVVSAPSFVRDYPDPPKTNEWHEVKSCDQSRIHCQAIYHGDHCSSPAVTCQHTGRSSFYYCPKHAAQAHDQERAQ